MNHDSPDTTGRRRDRSRMLVLASVGLGLFGALGAGYWMRASGRTLGDLSHELRRPDEGPRFEWRSIEKKHWQVVATTAGESAAAVVDTSTSTSAGCPAGMVRVKGMFRSELRGEATGEVERLQDAACTDWISRDFPARCRTFDREKIAVDIARLPTQSMDYCVDRFEYPNELGQNPMIVATFRESESMCKANHKRLCNENEWTFACEGEEARPYPYGWTRDATACVIDRPWRPFSENALSPRDGQKARDELDRLWQAEPSGSRSGCRSPFGVYDMTGNVDEWTRSVNATGYSSILKGGYWGPVRARCRPATRAHNEDFVAYQQGFRCCGDANNELPGPASVPPIAAVVDAGPTAKKNGEPLTAALSVDAGRSDPRASDLTAEWASDDDDEIEAITKRRVALCAAAHGPRERSRSGILIAFAALAMSAARRRLRK